MANADGTGAGQRVASRIDRTIDREAVAGLRQACWTRAVAMALIGAWVAYRLPFPPAAYYLAILALFAGTGLLHYKAAARSTRRAWPIYALIAFDIALLAAAVILPNPLDTRAWPQQMALHPGNFPFFYVILAGTLLTYAPRQVLFAGATIAVLWSLATLWIISLPETVTPADFPGWYAMPQDERVAILTGPHFVDVPGVAKDILIVLVVTGVLASVVWRMRRIAFDQAHAERQRANLARYFSPSLVEELAQGDQQVAGDKEQEAAVMFLDIHGFSAFAEQLPPQVTMAVLRSFHGRMSQQVFGHDGTLDKYIGDGLMATFGVPRKGPRDAANAIACALAMCRAIAEWNELRRRIGWQPIEIGIGIHYGPVVMGNLGSEERLEFAVIGDTVNVASRLEQLTRELKRNIVLSDDVVAAAHEEIGPDDPLFDGFREAPEQPLRGRLTGMIVWTYSDEVAEEDRLRRLSAADLAPSVT